MYTRLVTVTDSNASGMVKLVGGNSCSITRLAMPTEFKNGRPQIVRRPDDLPQPVPKPPGRKRRTTKVTLGSQLATDPHADTPWAAYARLAEEFRTHQC